MFDEALRRMGAVVMSFAEHEIDEIRAEGREHRPRRNRADARLSLHLPDCLQHRRTAAGELRRSSQGHGSR